MRKILFLVLAVMLFQNATQAQLPMRSLDSESVILNSPLIVVKVGSPTYYFLKDIARTLNSDENLIPAIDSFQNLGPNSLLIIENQKLFDLSIGKVSVPLDDGGRYFLYQESMGLVELVEETVSNSVVLTVGRSISQPIAGILASLASDRTLLERLENDALAIWESGHAPMYAFLDMLSKAKEGELTRSARGLVRIPFAIADLGLVVGNKILTLPFDVMKNTLNGVLQHFAPDGKDNEDLLRAVFIAALEEVESGKNNVDDRSVPVLTGIIEDQGIFIGRGGSHRLNVEPKTKTALELYRRLGIENGVLSINVRSEKFDLNEFVGKKVMIRSKFSAERRLGMCCSIAFRLMIEDIQLVPGQ